MSSVSDKRTSMEYGFRPSVNPGQSFKDFTLNVPDQAANNQTLQKHSEFKKPYLADSYQNMDYSYNLGPLPTFPDYHVGAPGSPEYPVPPVPPSPDYPPPKVPPVRPPPSASPPIGGEPSPYPPSKETALICCKGLYIYGPDSMAMDTETNITIGGGAKECFYKVTVSDGDFEFEGGFHAKPDAPFHGGTTLSLKYHSPNTPGTVYITVAVFTSVGVEQTSLGNGGDCISHRILIEGCESSHIDYTTQQMTPGSSQTLTVGDATAGATFEWTASLGSIGPTGSSVTYTAPEDAAECPTPLITLKVGGIVCDTLEIAVGIENSTRSYLTYDHPGHIHHVSPYGCQCNYDRRKWDCFGNDLGIDATNACDGGDVYFCQPTDPDGPCTEFPGGCPVPEPIDVRTPTMITNGCCPVALL
jgi:hypothetical protein